MTNHDTSVGRKPAWMDEGHYQDWVENGWRLVRGVRLDALRHSSLEYFTEYPYGVWECEGDVYAYKDDMGSGSTYYGDEIAEVYEWEDGE